MAEIETAVCRQQPVVIVIGNDGRWNAESELQRRYYGENRMHGCDLLPARYDLLASALGGHGEFVDVIDQLPGAIARAVNSGKPAVINVMTQSISVPALRLEPSMPSQRGTDLGKNRCPARAGRMAPNSFIGAVRSV